MPSTANIAKITGIHHVTSITADVQANVDFYMGFLGLHLVKRTGGYEDAEQLHLFYGDSAGSPGTLLSFLVWQAAGRGRTGIGQVSEVSLAVPIQSLGEWLTRALSARISVEGPKPEFGEPVLRLKDPDGLIVKLVGVNEAPRTKALGEDCAPLRIRGVTMLSDKPEETTEFVARFGYRVAAQAEAITRMQSDSDIVDIRASAGFVPSITGAGVPDHVAFRAADLDDLRQIRLSLKDYGPTHVHDRKYFHSLYVREPAGCLIEYATDAPGMGVDEPLDQLGRILFLPPHDQDRAEDLRVMLPQFVLPGEERYPMRDLPFIHRFYRPDEEDGTVIVLLHGSGGNETDLLPLAHKINPKATLLGVRGRSTEEGVNRWFRRFGPLEYDQDDIIAEAEAFKAFITGAMRGYGIRADELSFMGYSNGANLLGALMQLHPGSIERAILLRPRQVLETAPEATTHAPTKPAQVLLIGGEKDPFSRDVADLAQALTPHGIKAEVQILAEGHALSPEDVNLAQSWFEGLAKKI